jgi:hypothetical protein
MKKEEKNIDEEPIEEELEEASGGIDTVPLPEMPRSSIAIGTWPTPERPAYRFWAR